MRENGLRKKTATVVVGAPLDQEEMGSKEREMEVIPTRRIEIERKWKKVKNGCRVKKELGFQFCQRRDNNLTSKHIGIYSLLSHERQEENERFAFTYFFLFFIKA